MTVDRDGSVAKFKSPKCALCGGAFKKGDQMQAVTPVFTRAGDKYATGKIAHTRCVETADSAVLKKLSDEAEQP